MAIREATTSVEDPMPAEPRPDRRRRRRDPRAGPFPTVAMEQWHDTESALAKLYRYAEGRAIEATDWYLQDKRGKRIWSRGLRLLAILLVTAGALQPLLDAAAPGPAAPPGATYCWPWPPPASASTASSASPRAGCAP